MSEFTPLREAVDTLASRTPSPDFGELKRRATGRGRRRVVMAAAAAAAIIAVGGGLTAGTLGGSDQLSPIGEPTTPSPTTVQESAEASPTSHEAFATELHAILAQAPNWAINFSPGNYDPAVKGPCSGDWSKGELTWQYRELSDRLSYAGVGHFGFPSEAYASDAAARFVENLASCKKTAWRTQPIAQTGAVLASSAHAVAWIQQKGADVAVLQVPTTDGPPPVAVQVEVAEWVVAYIAGRGRIDGLSR